LLLQGANLCAKPLAGIGHVSVISGNRWYKTARTTNSRAIILLI